jgi:hypothetical protein
LRHRRIGLESPAHIDGKDCTLVRKSYPAGDALGDLAKGDRHLQEAERGEALGLDLRLRRAQGRVLGGRDRLVVRSNNEDAPHRCDGPD